MGKAKREIEVKERRVGENVVLVEQEAAQIQGIKPMRIKTLVKAGNKNGQQESGH